jgi:hypothetical protein
VREQGDQCIDVGGRVGADELFHELLLGW